MPAPSSTDLPLHLKQEHDLQPGHAPDQLSHDARLTVPRLLLDEQHLQPRQLLQIGHAPIHFELTEESLLLPHVVR